MRKFLLTQFCCLLLLTTAFGQNKVLTLNIKDNVSKIQKVPLSSIAKEIVYIPLETKKQSLLGRVKFVYFINNTYILASSNFCKAFDANGKYICDIGKVGEGPGEYFVIKKISFDKKNSLIYISSPKRILVYSFSGKYIKTIEVPDLAGGDGFFVANNVFGSPIPIIRGNEKNRLVFFNESGKITSVFPNNFPFKREEEMITTLEQAEIISDYNFNLLYKDGVQDTIFRISPNGRLSPYFHADMGKYRMPKSVISGAPTLQDFQKYAHLTEIVDSHSKLYLSYFFPVELYKSKGGEFSTSGKKIIIPTVHISYDKFTSKLTVLDNPKNGYGYYNDLDGGLAFWPRAVAENSDLIGLYDAGKFVEYLTDEHFRNVKVKNPEALKKLKSLVGKLTEEDNPVLVVVKPLKP